MTIWKKNINLELLNRTNQNTAAAHLGIEITKFGDDYLEAVMPVDYRTIQPMGFLNGGISVALAETLGSMAGFCCVDENQTVVGNEINASHLRPVREGFVRAKASPIKLGNSLQVWQIDIYNQQDKLCCISRLTLSVLNIR
ncbi:uncharacterized protein (TIGR00369 family) [Cricetibacter osteomyelitidis]|uniref:Uncharacterized protein (TIGR00369 family) n=1 Tax=Cricetibacter osteomyelitidis TaxID=1521931 RepID=A0A4R2T7L4_9PAST|nr:hotdog fold thioesterase [Cricetibacter osteomyelitidis]TCP97681.1 uncharacterized protein (TIGR00369 family) [Cricetibacter osteomyelitidis]